MDNSGSIVRAIRGPVCIITIGVLFAMNNFTRYRFDQTWPVILIVFGLLSLLKRGVEPPSPPPPPPPRYTPPAPPPPTYSQSPYSQPVSPPPAAGPAKGGFGSSAPPRSTDAPTSTPSGTEGGTQ